MSEHCPWTEALDEASREEVYRFRYSQYFCGREYLPGTDHAEKRVWLPHDDHSRHFLTRFQDGRIAAVATATPAQAQDLYPEWQWLLELDRIRPLLPKTIVISRAIVAKESRSSSMFGEMCLWLARHLMEEGYHFAVHYCAPAMVSLYERLGYRLYGCGKNLSSHVFRLPMLLVACDHDYLRKLHSPLRAVHRTDHTCSAEASALCPELLLKPLCARSHAELSAYLRHIAPPDELFSEALLRQLKRGALFTLRPGDVLAKEGIDEGCFLVLENGLRCGNAPVAPGSIVATGTDAVRAEKHLTLIAGAFEET